jgi:hypothetical protein
MSCCVMLYCVGRALCNVYVMFFVLVLSTKVATTQAWLEVRVQGQLLYVFT